MIHFYYKRCFFQIDLDWGDRWTCSLGFTSATFTGILGVCRQIAETRGERARLRDNADDGESAEDFEPGD